MNNFCIRCGSKMKTRFVEGRDREVCPQCGFIFYRNPIPAVAVVVEHGEGIVLVRRRFEPRAGLWALPAGFMELGETTEETAMRECLEETGLTIAIEGLLGVYSFSDRPGTSGIVIIYAAKSIGGEPAASDDAEEVAIYPADQMPAEWAFRSHQQALERWRTERRRRALAHEALLQHDDVTVRLAGFGDEQAALALLRAEGAAEAPGLTSPEALLQASARFHDRLYAADAPLLVAEVAGQVAGLLALTFRQTLLGWEGWIDHLRVAEPSRRRGTGRALVEGAIALARERGATTLATMPAAQQGWEFLRACGFALGEAATLQLAVRSEE